MYTIDSFCQLWYKAAIQHMMNASLQYSAHCTTKYVCDLPYKSLAKCASIYL